MPKEGSSFSSTSDSLSSATRHDSRGQRRGKKRQHELSSESDSSNGHLPEEATEVKKPSSRPETPNKCNPVDDVAKAGLEPAGPGSQKKQERTNDSNDPGNLLREAKISSPRLLVMNEPQCSKTGGKERCSCTKCRGMHMRRKDIVKDHMKRWSPLAKVSRSAGPKLEPRYDEDNLLKEVVEKDRTTERLLSRGSQAERKRAKRSGKEIMEDSRQSQSRESKSRELDSKSRDSKSRDSKSRGEWKSRDSNKSMESMDGQTELLESLVHAAHAEDKLHREKKILEKETKKLEAQKNSLTTKLKVATKAVEDLRSHTKILQKEKGDILKQLKMEKAIFEKELQATLRNEQASSARERDRTSQALQRFECSICFEELEGSYSKKKGKKCNELKQRACFRPCNHASACTECAVDVWEKTNKCPFCETKLSGKPAPIHF